MIDLPSAGHLSRSVQSFTASSIDKYVGSFGPPSGGVVPSTGGTVPSCGGGFVPPSTGGALTPSNVVHAKTPLNPKPSPSASPIARVRRIPKRYQISTGCPGAPASSAPPAPLPLRLDLPRSRLVASGTDRGGARRLNAGRIDVQLARRRDVDEQVCDLAPLEDHIDRERARPRADRERRVVADDFELARAGGADAEDRGVGGDRQLHVVPLDRRDAGRRRRGRGRCARGGGARVVSVLRVPAAEPDDAGERDEARDAEGDPERLPVLLERRQARVAGRRGDVADLAVRRLALRLGFAPARGERRHGALVRRIPPPSAMRSAERLDAPSSIAWSVARRPSMRSPQYALTSRHVARGRRGERALERLDELGRRLEARARSRNSAAEHHGVEREGRPARRWTGPGWAPPRCGGWSRTRCRRGRAGPPVSASQSTMPAAKRSARRSTGCACTCSGDM